MSRSLPPAQRRRPIRLRDYDYGSPGAYFMTICTHGRELLFVGELVEIISATWQRIPERFPSVQLDSFVVMPNHIHGIIVITDQEPVVGAVHEPPLQAVPQDRRRMLLPRLVGYFKMNAAKSVNLLRRTPGVPVWQRGYYEHVVRSEAELARIRQHIEDNPFRWDEDPENPASEVRPGGGGS